MKFKHVVATTLIILLLGVSCNSKVRAKNHDANELSFDWERLSDTTIYSVTYIQLNFSEYPSNDSLGVDILNLQSDLFADEMRLTNEQQITLSQFVIDNTNFSEGDCGTFHLNAGFIIYQGDKSVARINIGCGYNQWNFQPDNYKSKSGGLNDKGFLEMEKFLDNINKQQQKIK